MIHPNLRAFELWEPLVDGVYCSSNFHMGIPKQVVEALFVYDERSHEQAMRTARPLRFQRGGLRKVVYRCHHAFTCFHQFVQCFAMPKDSIRDRQRCNGDSTYVFLLGKLGVIGSFTRMLIVPNPVELIGHLFQMGKQNEPEASGLKSIRRSLLGLAGSVEHRGYSNRYENGDYAAESLEPRGPYLTRLLIDFDQDWRDGKTIGCSKSESRAEAQQPDVDPLNGISAQFSSPAMDASMLVPIVGAGARA